MLIHPILRVVSPTLPTADGYPLRATDPDFEMQEQLSRTLNHCRAMTPLHPTMGQLYPELCQTSNAAHWLGPALKRLDWNLRENPEGEQWAVHFGPMLSLILMSTESATEDQLFFLCEWAEFLREHNCHSVAEKIALFGWKLQKKSGLSDVALDQLRKAQRVFDGPGSAPAALLRIGWTLFRADNNTDDGDPCWSAMVRRDLRGMPKKLRQSWFALLDTNDHAWQLPGALPKSALKLLAGLDQKEFETALDRWTKALAAANPVHLSYTGLTLLNYLLRLCRALPAFAIDEALYRIAHANWKHQDSAIRDWDSIMSTSWLSGYLMVLPTRPANRAFACVEALMMNPATKDFADVERLYHSLLNASSKAAAPQTEAVTGVDGFRVEPAHAYAAEHALIDHFLRATHPDERLRNAGMMTPSFDPMKPLRESIVQQSAANLGNLVLALSERVSWLVEHARDFTDNTVLFWRVETGNLMGDILRKMPEVSLDVLIAALKSDSRKFFGSSPSWRIFDLCQLYVGKHGWNAELLDRLGPWIKTLHGTNTALDVRRKVEWLVWFEDVNPIQKNECWSSIIRADLRGMTPEERQLWLPVLMNASFATADKPPAKWLKPAKEAFGKLGVERFRARYRTWFQPFRDSQPLKLTIPGRDLLRMMIWYAMVAEDAAVDEALAWFAQGKWKTKQSADRSAKAETAFSYVMMQRNPEAARDAFERIVQSGRAYQGSKIHAAYLELCKRSGKPAVEARVAEQRGPDLEALKAKTNRKMKAVLIQQLGDSCSWDDDVLVVKGERDTYRIDSRSGRITRASDGAVVRVEIPYDQMPYKIYRAQIDGHDINNPGQPNLMRTMMCAQILLRGREDQIVEDTSLGGE